MSTALHEAAHAAACMVLGRPVEYVERTPGIGLGGEVVGSCYAPVPRTRSIEASDLGCALVGYWTEREPGWPPSFAEARAEPREALATLIEVLGLDADEYDQLVQVTRDLLADPHFIRLRDAIARALAAVPYLTAEDLAALCYAVGIPTSNPGEMTSART